MRAFVLVVAVLTLAVAGAAWATGNSDTGRLVAKYRVEGAAWKRAAWHARHERDVARARLSRMVRAERADARQARHQLTVVRRSYAALIAAQAKARKAEPFVPSSLDAIRLASSVYGVSESDMVAVARCETGGSFSPTSYNPSSGATGLFQWLPSSWAAQGFAGFSATHPYANALAAARAVTRDGGWSQWVCKPGR